MAEVEAEVLEQEPYGLIVVGAGPAGLSGGVNGASEGLRTVVLEEGRKSGGQAETTSCIRNYAGFDEGISGPELMGRMERQVEGFGGVVQKNMRAQNIRRLENGLFEVSNNMLAVQGRAVILATGVDYRELEIPGVDTYHRRGLEYGHPPHNGDYAGKEVGVIGGANSAGQAALFLAERGCKVTLMVRKPGLEYGMSQYLSDDVTKGKYSENITVKTSTEITEVKGDEDQIRSVELVCDGKPEKLSINGLFILIGAVPRTEWLPTHIRDDKGFIPTDREIPERLFAAFVDQQSRLPFPNETASPGVFAAGDIRSNVPQRRVASAVGDGVNAVGSVHKYLALSASKRS